MTQQIDPRGDDAEEAYRGTLDVMNLDVTTRDEIDGAMVATMAYGRPLYTLYATSLMLDYAPDMAKLNRWIADHVDGSQENTMMLAVQNMHSYMMTGWETGILNTLHTLTRTGLTKQQIMEIVMFSQLYAGMRGLGHTYRAAGDLLAVLKEPSIPAKYPRGWAPDPDAFKCGLDMSTRSLTEKDRKNMTEWWERTIGYVPNSYLFGMKHHPEFMKINRAKWERALKTVPKQFAPYNMLREHVTTGNREGLRETVLLAKCWGIDNHWIVKGIVGTAFYCTGTEGLYAVHDAVSDLLEG